MFPDNEVMTYNDFANEFNGDEISLNAEQPVPDPDTSEDAVYHRSLNAVFNILQTTKRGTING